MPNVESNQYFTITVFSDSLKLLSLSTSENASLQVLSGVRSAHEELGLETNVVYGSAGKIFVERQDISGKYSPVNLRSLGVRSGDILFDDAGIEVCRFLGGVLTDGTALVNGVPTGTVISGEFIIQSGFRQAYDEWAASISTVDVSIFRDEAGITSLVEYCRRILNVPQPTFNQIAAAVSRVSAYLSKIEQFESILRSYSVPFLAVVEKTFSLLAEQGEDRLRKLLLQAQFVEFFSNSYENSSFGQYLSQQAQNFVVEYANEPVLSHEEFRGVEDRFVMGMEEDYDPAWEIETETDFPTSVIEPLDYGLEE